MIRSDLMQKVLEGAPQYSAKTIERVVDLFFNEILLQLEGGGRVELRRFGIFSARSYEAHIGRNPRTGAAVRIQSKNRPYFRPGKSLLTRLNKGLEGSDLTPRSREKSGG